ncbi:glycine betaine ABC transporter substrate-binding protein [Oleiagrimonas sp. C23AA]|uniref:glycine betaine ABC transporter substrate-binding protein n=1 Tax=Oleiagrimonas sp. C23AA TaxID=2719047 RepID=UPI00141FF4A1|nr:glycine betaine ABC transporter substrate-binding protein [Oleiagrimonas sp. C23AA]NII11782.1 glycine betaine ABC transporter substrate-binding protein [Oleiagrimonas sp. C23AA]
MEIKRHALHQGLMAAVAVGALALAGCSNGNNNNAATQNQAADNGQAATEASGNAPAKAHGSVKLAYVEWSSCVAATDVMQATLEKQGFDVKTVSVSAAAMYTAIADGDADATVCAWLPTTQGNYYAKTKDQLTNLGANMKGTKLGLVVPKYVDVSSISDLAKKSVADKFDDRIVGIDPGAGEMGMTQKAIDQYKLPMKLIDGSGATMTAALKSAIDNHEPIVVTGWTPHWMWARWDLKYLDDPKGIYGNAEEIDTLVRKGLKQDMPAAYATLDAFNWTPKDMQQVMAANQKSGSDAKANARQWVGQHADMVSGWTGQH